MVTFGRFCVAGVRLLDIGRIDLAAEMDRSVFCLGLPGAGFGTRAVLAVIRGCIPVLVGDNIAQPFENLLDWTSFSIRVPEALLDGVYELLVSINETDRQRMAGACQKNKKHLVWDEKTPGDAFDTLMRALSA